MEIHQLELLDVLVKQGSFKKAAEATFVSTSTLTRQVSSMEAELGFPLFIRSAYGISLTEQGEVFYRETRAIVHAYEAAVLSARSTDSLHRLIRIGTYSYIRSAITRTCADLKRRCPWLSFSFASCRFTDSCDVLRSRKADLILLAETEQADDSVCTLPVFRAFNIVIAVNSHPLAARAAVRAEELNGQTILLPKMDSSHKNCRNMKKLYSVHCPDSEIVDFEHPDQADALCMMNGALISSISLLDVGEDRCRIRIVDAPKVEIGLMCRKEDEEQMMPLMLMCRDFYRSAFDPERLELIQPG